MPLKARKRWTVLIYMVADDPQGGELLDKLAIQEMDQITKAALSVKHEEIFMSLCRSTFGRFRGSGGR